MKFPKQYMIKTQFGMVRHFLFSCEGVGTYFTQHRIEAARSTDKLALEDLAKIFKGKVVEWKPLTQEEIEESLSHLYGT